VHTAAISICLALNLSFSPPVTSSQERSEAQKFGALQLEERSVSVLQAVASQTEVRPSPLDAGKLTEGTPVRLRFTYAVVSSRVIAGENVTLEVVDPVTVGSIVAISPRALAEATVTVAQANRTLGRGGTLQLKMESVFLTDGESVSLRAVKDVRGGANEPALLASAGAAGLMYLAGSPVVFLFMVKGKTATIPAGTEITAYIAEEFPLDASKFHATQTGPQEKKHD
jgi:hypothetical protein